MPAKLPHSIQGMLELESVERPPDDLKLMTYVFDEDHQLLATGRIGKKGEFKVAFKLAKQRTVMLFISPEADEKDVRGPTTYSHIINPDDWKEEERNLVFKPDIFLPRDLWWPWWPRRICVSGHVRKVGSSGSTAGACPVPYVKVEVFDVDREGCWWPYIIRRWREVLDRPVFRIPELMKEPPEPPVRFPEPFPGGPIAKIHKFNRPMMASATLQAKPELLNKLEKVGFNPQSEPPGMPLKCANIAALSPQPEPPDVLNTAEQVLQRTSSIAQVGEMSSLDPKIAARLDSLTLSSKIAPWKILRWCFYSKAKVCETFTDCDGYFRCCFSWWPWHFRRGRMRFDRRPDIILKVTQIIDGVETVIFMDPYTSTRWNVTSTHIDLYLDDEEIICGPGCGPGTDFEDSQAAVLQIGCDEVWKINQANGMYTVPGINNGAYGRTLILRGDFSTNLKTGSPKRYYRLSYAKMGGGGATPPDSSFAPITTPLSVLRASFTGPFHTYNLGPQTVNTTPALFEVQDTAHWWITPWQSVPYLTVAGGTVLGLWPTASFESDEGTYILRMEVFDEHGVKMAAIEFPNHGGDGSGTPPDPVPLPKGHLDLKIHVDNKPLIYDLEVDPAPGSKCGIIKWSDTLFLNFNVLASQENGRVHSWSLYYIKGMNPAGNYLGDDTYLSGITTVNATISGADLLKDTTPSGKLEESCAFALILRAWSHVRVNYGWHRYANKEYAIAIEKCPPPCPPVIK
ncbi:MAG: hypothetical protein U9R57_14695 [Thermodesulfobacteriota bacterium]|nr:hypothetical protein [Thermodesulfobacteriota bacterium]